MKLLDGKALALKIETELAVFVKKLKKDGIQPKLAVVLVGENPASKIYVAKKQDACQKLGISSILKKLPAHSSQNEILEVVAKLNQDQSINGILCQAPFPKEVAAIKIFQAIDAQKDVDCFHPYNIGLLTLGNPTVIPCTPYGMIQLLIRHGFELCGKNIVVLGRSNIVGRPLSILCSLKRYNATVQVCHSATNHLAAQCRRADILLVGIGSPKFVGSDFVKEGAVVIDAGINRIQENGKNRIVGDVDFEAVKTKVAALTPVPGGVGPMTISMLLYNCINLTAVQNNLPKFNL